MKKLDHVEIYDRGMNLDEVLHALSLWVYKPYGEVLYYSNFLIRHAFPFSVALLFFSVMMREMLLMIRKDGFCFLQQN